MNHNDVRIIDVQLQFLPLKLRVPLKFGGEISTGYDTAKVRMTVEQISTGKQASGYGESPLSPAWAWPGELSFSARLEKMRCFCRSLQLQWQKFQAAGHALEIGHQFLQTDWRQDLPELAALTCNAAFDLALHDAYGIIHELPIYQTYNRQFLNHDLEYFFEDNIFRNLYPDDFLIDPPQVLPVWHLVGGKDLLQDCERTGQEPDDGYPLLLDDWITQDGLKCLKIKLTGKDDTWDFQRLLQIGRIALERNVDHLSADFNCMVKEPDYVNDILDRLLVEHPKVYNLLLYVEQPFPYDLESNQIDVHSVSARKPLFMDESAHNWKLLRLGRSLGWTGVALKTCKTQTGALLSACWAKQHGMTLMVQDLTNPRLAMIPHVQLAAHVGTIMGIECNAMQFYPDASAEEEVRHPGIYRRRNGVIDRKTLNGPGFGN